MNLAALNQCQESLLEARDQLKLLKLSTTFNSVEEEAINGMLVEVSTLIMLANGLFMVSEHGDDLSAFTTPRSTFSVKDAPKGNVIPLPQGGRVVESRRSAVEKG